MSSHADREDLLKWINNFKVKPKCVFVVHGEDLTCKNFALRLVEQDFKAIAPKYTSIYDLETFEPYFEGKDLIRRSDLEYGDRRHSDRRSSGRKHGEKLDSPVFQRLMLAGMRLVEVIARNKGGTNKDLAKFADQIDSLSNKWDR
jgi:metallo-beta-lactamase family protein